MIDSVKKYIENRIELLKLEFINPIRRGICEMRGTVYVGGKVATEADLVAQVVKRSEAL